MLMESVSRENLKMLMGKWKQNKFKNANGCAILLVLENLFGRL